MSKIKKPGFGTNPDTRKLAEVLEVIMGRRGTIDLLADLQVHLLTVAPTASDFNALVNDVANVRAKLNELLQRLQD